MTTIFIFILAFAFFIAPFVFIQRGYEFKDSDYNPVEVAKFKSKNKELQRKYLVEKYAKYCPKGFTVAFKGFSAGLICMNDFKYKEGKHYVLDGEAVTCSCGFHSCYFPLDVVGYYHGKGTEYHIVFIKGQDSSSWRHTLSTDSKVASKEIIVGPKIPNYYFE